MLSRDEVLARIDEAYATRIRGDKAELAHLWADGARFEQPGDRAAFAALYDVEADPQSLVEQIIDRVEMHSVERVEAVVEGNRAAILWRASLSIGGEGPVATMLYDLWELDDDRRVKALVQFADTALIARMARSGS